jgi:hypothetical protein
VKSWSDSFRRRVERRRQARRVQQLIITFQGLPFEGPIFPGMVTGEELAPWQADLIERLLAQRSILEMRARLFGRHGKSKFEEALRLLN